MWTATVVEIYIAIIGACAVTLVPVYRKLRTGNVWSTKQGDSSEYAKSGRQSSSNHIISGGHRRPTAAHERIYDGDSAEHLRGPVENFSWRDTKVTGHVRQKNTSLDEVPLDGIVVKRDVVLESAPDHL